MIGGILLDARTSPNYFKTFYIRRAHRILPVYMATAAVFWVLFSFTTLQNGNAAYRWVFSDPAPWYSFASITQNFAMMRQGTLGPAWLGVTWSLAVEEQFYLTLPFIIRFVSPRRLPYVLAVIIVAAPVVRTLLRLFYFQGDLAAYILLPCRAGALMLGVGSALLMRCDRARQFLAGNRRLLYGIILLLSCGMVRMMMVPAGLRAGFDVSQSRVIVQSTLLDSRNLWIPFRFYARTAISSLNYTWIDFFYLCVLLIAITQKSSLLSRLLRNRLLLGAGMISYAAYLSHQAILGLCYGLLQGHRPVIGNLTDLSVAVMALIVTLALATASWTYFEKPLVRRGHKYRYEATESRVAL